jgi:hypothetical protein
MPGYLLAVRKMKPGMRQAPSEGADASFGDAAALLRCESDGDPREDSVR